MLSPALSLLAALPPVGEDAPALLQQMQAAFHHAGTLHARLWIHETPQQGEPREFWQELWIDAAGGRVRSEVRDPRRPAPHLTLLAGPEGLLLFHADAQEVAQQPMTLDLAGAVDAALAGELWRTALRGDLAGMKAESYGTPRLGPAAEVAGVPCLRIDFPGNQTSSLWLSRDDLLPRRLEGALPGLRRREEVHLLETGQVAAAVFRFAAPPGVRVVPLALARQRWSELPLERERWPARGAAIPGFLALGPDGEPRGPEDLDLPCVLAFWFEEHQEVRDGLLRAQAGLEPLAVPLVSVHPGDDPSVLPALADRWHLTHEVWLDGGDARRPFRAFSVATCPVFFLLDEAGHVQAATAEADGLLEAVRRSDRGPRSP